MRTSVRLMSFFVVVLFAALFMPISTGATNVTVWCSGSTPPDPLPADNYLTMTDALNALSGSPNGPHTIFLHGTCHNENLQIIGFSRLTIQAAPTETAIISQDQATACGMPAATPAENQPSVRILDSHQITFRINAAAGGAIILRGGTGVGIEDSSVSFQGVTVENSRVIGVGVNIGGRLNINGTMPTPTGPINIPNYVQNNCGTGISVDNGSSLGMGGGNAFIQNNNGAGVVVGGFANLSGFATVPIVIENNQGPGLNVINPGSVATLSGNVIIDNNSLSTTLAPFRGGIVVTSGFVGIGNGGVQIFGNNGPGIWADMQAKLRLGPPVNGMPSDVTISGNTEEGVRILHMSVVWSNSGTASSNGTADVTCDSTSLLFGNIAGFAVNKCANTEQAKKNN